MPHTPINLPLWKDLYDAAQDFVAAAPWAWMRTDEVFGLKDPDTKIFGLCTILGNLGINYGMSLHPGPKGAESLARILHPDKDFIHDPAARIDFRAIVMDLGDPDVILLENIDIMKSLGLKFKDKCWISFRSHNPGLRPVIPEDWEIKFMTHALRQALIVAKEAKKNKAVLELDADSKLLCRVFKKGEWTDTRHAFSMNPEPLDLETYPLNEVKIELVKQKATGWKPLYEADMFYSLGIVRATQDTPEYHPAVMLIVDRESHFVICAVLSEPAPRHVETYRNAFLDGCLKTGNLPRKIRVSNNDLGMILEPVVAKMNIEIEYVEELEIIPEIRNELLNRMSMGGSVKTKEKQAAGRNDPCPCGSGKKYKKCCGK